MTTVFEKDFKNEDEVNNILKEKSNEKPDLVKYIADPIVSSDVIGMKESVVLTLLVH